MSTLSSEASTVHSVYFDTELKMNVERLKEMIYARVPALSDAQMSAALSRVDIRRPVSCKGLLAEVEGLEATVIAQGVKFICIDSIAALARKEGLVDSEKEMYIVRQASVLK